MSGPTKADLERRIQQLERELEIAHEQIRDLLDGADRYQYNLKTTNDAFTKAILDSTDHINARDNIIEEHGKFRRTKQERDKAKSKYTEQEYEQLLAEGAPHGIARTKANKATAKKFGTGFKKSALYKHCPPPDADK